MTLVLLGAAATGGWFYTRPQSPEQVVKKCIDACMDGDIDAVSACMTDDSAEALQNWLGGEQIFILLMKHMADGSAESISISPATYDDNDKAYVGLKSKRKLKISKNTNANISIELVLVRERGKWRIDADLSRDRIMRMIKM